jgi:hypothetical protein
VEDKLVGAWKGSDQLFARSSGPNLVATIDGGLSRQLKTTLKLNRDRTYQKLVGEYDSKSGSWELAENELILVDELGKTVLYKLLKVTNDELIISNEVTMDTPDGEIKGTIRLSYTR